MGYRPKSQGKRRTLAVNHRVVHCIRENNEIIRKAINSLGKASNFAYRMGENNEIIRKAIHSLGEASNFAYRMEENNEIIRKAINSLGEASNFAYRMEENFSSSNNCRKLTYVDIS